MLIRGKSKSTTDNIFKKTIYAWYPIAFIEYILAAKHKVNYTNLMLYQSNDYKKVER